MRTGRRPAGILDGFSCIRGWAGMRDPGPRSAPGRRRQNPRTPEDMPFTIAIDGPAASGKGTIARALARHFGFAHLDTGLLYRAVGAKGGDPVAAARALVPEDLARDDLRSAEAGQAASRVAAIPEVRAALVEFQRRFARSEPGAVLDGRDIGTVICPGAELKLYVTASDETRARRRALELGADEARILAELRERDARDAARDVAPMRPAEDALLFDTTEMSIDEAVAHAIARAQEAGARAQEAGA
ncbi:MAG: (d)CMP kinase [Paracoccus sp. BP8]|nr:MAG: (d)CMP kinase [Paracoccus sp. BP8]